MSMVQPGQEHLKAALSSTRACPCTSFYIQAPAPHCQDACVCQRVHACVRGAGWVYWCVNGRACGRCPQPARLDHSCLVSAEAMQGGSLLTMSLFQWPVAEDCCKRSVEPTGKQKQMTTTKQGAKQVWLGQCCIAFHCFQQGTSADSSQSALALTM